MRPIYLSAVFFLVARTADASCPADACYVVSFKVLSCEATSAAMAAPNPSRVPDGVLLTTGSVTARPVSCALGGELWKPTGIPAIQSEHTFFYRSAGYEKSVCRDLKGKR